MPIYAQNVLGLRCPVCLAREIDVVLYVDGEEYYCIKCGYTGTEAETREAYKPIRGKFKLLRTRVKSG